MNKNKNGTVKFTKKDVKEYLNNCINYWRKRRDNEAKWTEEHYIAKSYVDAFQSIKISLFGELKK